MSYLDDRLQEAFRDLDEADSDDLHSVQASLNTSTPHELDRLRYVVERYRQMVIEAQRLVWPMR